MALPKSPPKKVFPGFRTKGYLTQSAWTSLHSLLSDGKSVSEIARNLNVDRKCVRYWRDAEHAPDSPTKKTQAKRAQSTTVKAKRQRAVAALMKKKDARGMPIDNSCSAIVHSLREKGFKTSRTTVFTDLKALGFSSRFRGKTPFLTDEKKEKRVEFCRRFATSGAPAIWFSDEKLFNCNETVLRCWCPHGENPPARITERWTATAHVWGVVGVGWRKLVFLGTDKVTGEGYVDTLRRYLLPAWKREVLRQPGLLFMQDGAPAHTSKVAKKALEKWRVAVLSPWPPTSPDLNPIENVWALVVRKMGTSYPRKREALIAAIEEAWNSIPQETIDKLVTSFVGRCHKCVALGGAKVQK